MAKTTLSVDRYTGQQPLRSLAPGLLVFGDAKVNLLQLFQVAKLREALVGDMPTASVELLECLQTPQSLQSGVRDLVVPIQRNSESRAATDLHKLGNAYRF